MAREDIGSPPAAHIHYSVCLSVCQISLLLHVRSGLGYPAMPLSCLPSWTPGPRVSAQTHANLGSWPHCHPRQNKGPVDMTEPQGLVGGCDNHPHSWPPACGFPHHPSHTRLLSCLQLRVHLICATLPTTEVCGWEVILAAHRLPHGRPRFPQKASVLHNGKRGWDCTVV